MIKLFVISMGAINHSFTLSIVVHMEIIAANDAVVNFKPFLNVDCMYLHAQK